MVLDQRRSYIKGQYERVIALMENKRDYINTTDVVDVDGEEYSLECEYDFIRETYDRLVAGNTTISDESYLDILQNFLYLYIKSLDN